MTTARTGTPPTGGITAVGAARVLPEVVTARGCVRLYSWTHIDLQRVAGALCRP